MARQKLIALIMVALVLSSTLVMASPAKAAPAQAPWEPFRYFPETGHNIGLRIKSFYDRYGGVKIFGLPITELIEEEGRQVQYFERARFEVHPENPPAHYVQLTLLGAIQTQGRTDPAFAPAAPADPNTSVYFPETGHNLGQGFLAFWKQYGGLPAFGYPISEEFAELSPTDGQVYSVQYFERARFEWHPDYGVELGHLGAEYFKQRGLPSELMAPVRPISKLGDATTGFRGSAAERVNNIARAASRFNGLTVKPGETFSFLKYVGDMSAAEGFTEGYAIIGGKLEKVIGGGVCQVSTTLYRAVFRAGFPIVERVPHSFIVYFYENIPGFDATVFSPTVDFRWRNDSNNNIYIYSETDPGAGTVTFSLWGYSDGRKVEMLGPEVKNRKAPGAPVWQYDSSLGRGKVVQLVHGRPGMDVDMWRVIRKADGSLLRKDYFPTRYRPWEDFYIYGPGVSPPEGVTIAPPRQ